MHKKQHGFTLIELMIVIILVGLLASIAYPVYSGFVDRARRAKVIGDIGQIQIALAKFLTDTNGALPLSLAAVGLDTLRDPWGNPRGSSIPVAVHPATKGRRKYRNCR